MSQDGAHGQSTPAKRSCAFPGCGRAYAARGLCKGHYDQRADGRELSPIHVGWTLHRLVVLRDLYWRNVAVVDIARRLGVSAKAASIVIEKQKLRRPRLPQSWNPERMKKLRELHASGLPWKEIAEQLGVSSCAARSRAQRAKLRRPEGAGLPRCHCGLLLPCGSCLPASAAGYLRRGGGATFPETW